MLADELLDTCRRHGFDGTDAEGAAQWFLAQSTLSSLQLLPDTFSSVTLADDEMEETEETSERPALLTPAAADRYEDLGLLGTGGMGEVRRVRDRALNRTMALKAIRPERVGSPAAVARFVEEAQATAQLQHPGILPVHELGSLPDGRLYFTMKEVRGRTLGDVIAEVHAVSEKSWEPASSG